MGAFASCLDVAVYREVFLNVVANFFPVGLSITKIL